jgi:hypothetical protein
LPAFLSSIIQYPYSSAQPNLAVATSAVVVNATTTQTSQQGIIPPAQSFMSIPTGTPVSFNMATAGSTITLPAGGTITDAIGNNISIPQRSVIIALGQDPNTGNYGIIGGFLLNTGPDAGQIQLPGAAVAAVAATATTPAIPAQAPLVTPDANGNVALTYNQLAAWGDIISNGTNNGAIIEPKWVYHPVYPCPPVLQQQY